MRFCRLLILILLCLAAFLQSEGLHLTELINPQTITIGSNRIYVTEEAKVLIFSTDGTLLKKFGETGQGPGEWITRPGVNISLFFDNGQLFINSLTKISIFSLAGKLKREVRAGNVKSASSYQPINGKIASWQLVTVKGIKYLVYFLYDRNLQGKREFFRQENLLQPLHIDKGFNPLIPDGLKMVCKDQKILIEDINACIHVFNHRGELETKISHPYPQLLVNEQLKQKVYQMYKTHPGTAKVFEFWKKRMKFPKHFPLVRDFYAADGFVYVLPYAKTDGKNCFYQFSSTGEFIKVISSPLQDRNVLKPFPYAIQQGKLYQLIENDDEEWELRIYTLE